MILLRLLLPSFWSFGEHYFLFWNLDKSFGITCIFFTDPRMAYRGRSRQIQDWNWPSYSDGCGRVRVHGGQHVLHRSTLLQDRLLDSIWLRHMTKMQSQHIPFIKFNIWYMIWIDSVISNGSYLHSTFSYSCLTSL